MRITKLALVAAASIVLSAGAAKAADVLPVIVAAPPPPVAAPAPAGFDWSGLYLGVYGGYNNLIPPGAAGVLLGYNFNPGRIVVGVQARAGAFFPGIAPSGIDLEASLNLRVGFLVGDRILLYAIAGVGYVPVAAYLYWTAGAGAEFALGERFSIFADLKAENCFGCFPVGLMFRAGINWHR